MFFFPGELSRKINVIVFLEAKVICLPRKRNKVGGVGNSFLKIGVVYNGKIAGVLF